jgi:hypothetical protein
MNQTKTLFILIGWLISCLSGPLSFAATPENVVVTVEALDPSVESIIGSDELLYGLINYKSDIPLRFQAIAMHQGQVLEVGAIKNPGVLHEPGTGKALVWVGYTNPTHIDAIRVSVLDEEWHELYQLNKEADVTWQGDTSVEPRDTAEWVNTLTKTERRKMDFVYDPAPQKFGTLYDILFFLTMASFPAYVLLQLHMLWRYNYRWRELAIMPLFPYLIVLFYVIAGLGIETSLLVTFLFRYTPLALLYLVCLWIAKRFWQKKLPPPKLYKPPKT